MTENSFYFDNLARAIVHDLEKNTYIKEFANNSAVIGAYAEASVNELITRLAYPLHVSTGAIIGPDLCDNPKTVPQIDTIIWTPSPYPAIFELDDFALVPRMSVLAFMEIKRSNYPGVGKKLKEKLDMASQLTMAYPDGFNIKNETQKAALGIICVEESSKGDSILKQLIKDERVIVLLRKEGDEYKANHDAVLKLVNFMVLMRQRSRHMVGEITASPKNNPIIGGTDFSSGPSSNTLGSIGGGYNFTDHGLA